MKKIILPIILTFLILNLSAESLIDTVPNTQQTGKLKTSWAEFETASPSAGMSFIEPPAPNSTGDATVDFPLNLPEARNGLVPSLNISYSSDGGTSWLGTGWNLSLPSFTLDTRWGVPIYDSSIESEIYLFNGEQLGPVFYRALEYERESERVFHLRQELAFQKIIRHGDSPKNYWWEVKDKDGTTHYYGGTPDAGFSSEYVLQTTAGNITEWYLSETTDVYGNLIKYRYQQIGYKSGYSVYPEEITYNGFQGVEGGYKVNFSLKPRDASSTREDVVINCRTGMQYAMADLLDEIRISYKGQNIRSYQVEYLKGPFSKTLLQSISEYNSQDEFFYKYDFEYHDDLVYENGALALFGSEQTWQVPKDNLDVNPVVATAALEFLDEPTILGGATSWNAGITTAVTIGLIGNLASKENTIGPNGGGGYSNATGVTSLVDIDSDGLPDKLWKEDGKLYYRPNLNPIKTGNFGFSPNKIELKGINDFSLSNAISFNVGAEVNVGIGSGVSGFFGYSYSNTTTNITTYMADFNGDELLDIAHNRKVYFNSLDDQNRPTFSLSSADTESPIFVGEPIDASLITVDPNEQENVENANPLQDAVKLWIAPRSGSVTVSGSLNLVNVPQGAEPENRDGVIVMIQHQDSELWRERILEDDFSVKTPIGVGNITVAARDSIFFRVHSVYNGHGDQVEWDPIITYVGADLSEVNADEVPNHQYQASKDFLLSDVSDNVMVRDGVVSLQGQFIKPISSDSVFLQLRGGIVWDTVFAPSEVIDLDFNVPGFAVTQASKVECIITSKSNIDWPSITWMPTFVYTALSDGSDPLDANGDFKISICPTVEFKSYNVLMRNGQGFIAPETGNLTLTAMLSNPMSMADESYLSAKILSKVDSVKRIGGEDLTSMGPDIQVNLDIQVEQGDTVFAELCLGYESGFFTTNLTSCTYSINGETGDFPCSVYRRDERSDFLKRVPYRGWKHFSYNGNDGRGNTRILFGELIFDEDAVVGDTTLIEEEADSTQISMNNVDADELFILMRSDPKSQAWHGSDSLTFINASTFSASRTGLQDVDLNQISTPSGSAFTTTNLKTKTDSHAVAAGGAVGQVDAGGGITPATSWSLIDVSDLNGDRYPDILFENSIQYTNHRGGLSSRTQVHDWGTHVAKSLAVGGGIGGSYVDSGAKNSLSSPGKGTNKSSSRLKSTQKGKMSSSRNAFESSSSSIGISGNFSEDKDRTKHTFADINGDGLEDKIWEGGDVALNLGYDFAAIAEWDFNDIRTGVAYDGGGGVGISYDNNSYAAGLSVSATDNQSWTGFTDFNNDALVDLIVSTEPLVVRMNTGSGFADPITLTEMGEIDSGFAIGESLNIGVTGCVPFVFIKVCINVVTSAGQGTSSVNRSFADIDGDGFVDLLTADGDDGHLISKTSNIRRTNLLKSITSPLGAITEIDYSLEGNVATMPFSKWVMTKVAVNDGVEGDGVDVNDRSFAYNNPYYDRHERIMYGFEEVKEIYVDEEEKTLRQVVSIYHVDDYYRKGLKKEESILDENDILFQKSEYTYALTEIENGLQLPPSYENKDDGMCFPALIEKKIKSYEGLDQFLTRSYIYEYDNFGNITSYTDFDETGNTLVTNKIFQYDDQKYLHVNVLKETMSGNGNIYRQRDYELDEFGNVLSVKEAIGQGEVAITEMTYDIYGNVLSKLNPENYKGERLSFDYEYDQDENQYLVKEKNGYGEEMLYSYEYQYNKLNSFTDVNNHTTLFEQDSYGRDLSITYPKEIEAGQAYSIRYEYYPGISSAYAIAYHFDPTQIADLRTFEFEDGLFRSIQSKVDASIHEGANSVHKMIVSGTEAFDEMGRYTQTYLPLSENVGTEQILNSATSPVVPTLFEYDIMDRLVRAQDAYGGVTTYEYGISMSNDGKQYLSLEITNPLGNKEVQYFNLRGDIVANSIDGPSGKVWVNYKYDDFNQVTEIIDHFGNETRYKYDLLGRRTSVKVPDAGLTELRYDKAGNLTERITATIRDVINENGSIRYQYDKERLVQIDYPKHFQNKVIIHYGTPQDSFNRVGRIWLIEDATGGREYFFDEYGNPSKTIRTVMINRSNVFTYVSQAKYDSWGRVLEYFYPDGEQLTYQYHIGGQLASMSGKISESTEVYLPYVGYDEHLDRVLLNYGNGSKEQFWYDDKRRLDKKSSTLSNGVIVANEIYSYDLADNLVSRLSNSGMDDLGGSLTEEFSYDQLFRLSSAVGQWSASDSDEQYSMFLDYDELNNLTMKNQVHMINNEQQVLTTRVLDYQYGHVDQSTRPSEVGGRDFHYDANGNLLLKNSQAVFDFDQNIFDEENRLIGSSNNGYISRYTYDAFGRRTIKSHGEHQGIFVNGAPAGFLEHISNFKVLVSPYFSVLKNDYHKHYFLGDTRILTKLGTGLFQTTLGQGPELTAGGIDYKKRIKQYEDSILEYYADLGVAPGPPSLLALLGQPEINDVSLPDATGDNPWNTPPGDWPMLSAPDTLGPPGIPVFYESAGINNENVEAGYNFSLGNLVKELEQFYYHYDQNGSTQYVTDYAGETRQYAAYFPSGERWISQKNTPDETSFQWNALAFDEETGMYDLGNIYYDPTLNIEQSIDPVLQHFGQETFLKRTGGDLFYDYSDGGLRDDDPRFDLQILNSERPSPFLGISASSAYFQEKNEFNDFKITSKEINEAFGGSVPWNATKSDVVGGEFQYNYIIRELAPQLAVIDISDQSEIDRVVQQFFDESVASFKDKVKKALGQKSKTTNKSKTKKVGRNVRFK